MSDKRMVIGDRNTDFISYLDEAGVPNQVHVEIVEITQAYISFKTYGKNIITIPMTRVLKIKRKEEQDVD